MATTSQITLQGSTSGDLVSQQTINAVIANSNSPNLKSSVACTTGNNTVVTLTTVNTATMVVIQPPAGNTVALTLKGVAGDTGVPMHLTQPTVLSVPPATALTIVVNAASPVTLEVLLL